MVQHPTNAYTVSGTTLSFTEAPASGDAISVRIFSNITNLDKVVDADGDTKIEVERTSDDDTIRLAVAGSDKITVTSTTTTISGLVNNVQSISGPGAISLTETVTFMTTTGTDAYTLADGTNGQIKIIQMVGNGGTGTVTPTNLVGWTSISFNNIHDNVTLLYTPNGWAITALQNATKT